MRAELPEMVIGELPDAMACAFGTTSVSPKAAALAARKKSAVPCCLVFTANSSYGLPFTKREGLYRSGAHAHHADLLAG
jgi:hypothetical protein